MAFNYSPKVVTDGLVLYLDAANSRSYPGSGTTWSDISRGGNNGTLVNGPTYSSANGGSIVFDGTNDYVNCGNISATILSNNQFTVSFWLRQIGSARGDFFGIKNFNALQDDIGFFIDADNKLYAYFRVQNVLSNNLPNTYSSVSNTTFIRNTIYNIVCMKEASQKIAMYVNGVLDNNTYSTVTNTANVVPTPLWIGSNKTNPTTPALSFAGNIYTTQIYNRALSASEILQNYNAHKSRYGLT